MASVMKEVASLLGVELGEQFKIKTNGGIQKHEYVFRTRGFYFVDEGMGKECAANDQLAMLLTGEAEIVKRPWRPKKGETYRYWANYINVADYGKWRAECLVWRGSAADVSRLAMGNCFPTEEELLANKDEVIKLYSNVQEATEDEKE